RVLPEISGNRRAPGEHSDEFADQNRHRALLDQADLDIQTFEKITDGLWVGRTPADVLTWFARLREGRILEVLDATARRKLLSELQRELERRVRSDGVYLAGTAWLVDARAQGRKVRP